MMHSIRRFTSAAAVCALLIPAAFPSGTATWELNSYNDFIRGKFQGISLSREGRLSLSPKVDTLFTSDQPVVWALAQGPMVCSTPPPDIATPLPHRRRRQEHAAVDRRAARDLRDRCGPLRRSVRRHVAGWQGIQDSERQGGGILRPQGALHLVACHGLRPCALCRHGRPGKSLPRGQRGPRRSLVRDRAIPRHRARGGQSDRLLAGRSRTEFSIGFRPRTRPSCSTSEPPEIRAIVPMPDGTVYAGRWGSVAAAERQPGRKVPGREPASLLPSPPSQWKHRPRGQAAGPHQARSGTRPSQT